MAETTERSYESNVRDLWENTQGTPGVKRGSLLFNDSEGESYALWLAVETKASDTLRENGRTLPYRSFLECLQGLCPPMMVDENTRESLTQRLHDRILLTFEPGDGGTPLLAPKTLHEKELKSRLRAQAKFLQFLNLLIRLGNAQEVWQWCPPKVPMLLDREPTPFTPEGMEGYLYVQHVRKLLWIDLQRGRTPEGLVAEGRILVSALIYGGLGEVAALRELHKALRSGAALNHFPRLGWSFLDLEIPMGRGGTRLRRWFPDPLSEVLILRYVPIRQPADQYTTADLLKAMNAYLHMLPKDQGKFLRARHLIRNVPQTLRIEQPQFLGAYASGGLTAHAVRSDRWWRLHGYEAPVIGASATIIGTTNGKAEEAPSEAQETGQDIPVEVVAEVTEAIQTVSWLQSLRTILRGTNRAFALQRLDAKSREELPDVLSRLFYGWTERLLKNGSAYRHRLAMRTIRRYVSRLAGLMLQLLEDPAAIETFRDPSWRQLYEDLLDHVETEHQRALLARAIREWHQYLVEENRAIPLPDQDLGGLAIDVVPDARVISLKEFTALKEAIAHGRHVERHVQLPIVLTLIAILGFRCGLRRMEVLRLRLMDCHLTGRATLLIRPFAERSLKSRNATRAIPLYALLEEEELKLLLDWVHTREKAGGQPQNYLFVLSEIGHNPISQETAMSRIHEAMRRVTGDEKMHFHHLRHSFASHLLWQLSLAQVSSKAIPGFWCEEQQTAIRFYERLFGHNRGSRKHLYAMTSLLGHSGPEISVNHYVHNLDLLLALYLRAHIPQEANGWRTLLPEISQPTLYRVLGKEGLDGLLVRARKIYATRMQIPLEITQTANMQAGVNSVGGLRSDVRIDEIWQILRQGFLAHGNQVGALESSVWDSLSQASDFSYEQLFAMASKAKAIYSLCGRMGMRHRPLEIVGPGGKISVPLPARIHTAKDQKIFRQILPFFWQSVEKDPLALSQVLEMYLLQAWANLPGYFLAKSVDSPEDALAFRQLLFDWGIKPGQIAYVSYDPAERSIWRQRWRKVLHLHKGIDIENRNLPDPERAKFWLHLYPRFPRAGRRPLSASPGFTYLLIMGAIVLAGRVLPLSTTQP